MRVGSKNGIVAKDFGWRHTGRKAWALRDVSFQIEPGERVLLVGASGSGKSTLLHALAGVLNPEEGEAPGELTLNGNDSSDPTLRTQAGLVQQDPDSQVVMETIGDEVAFGLENLGVAPAEIWPRVEKALAQVGLDLPLDHSTFALSGGQKQRLALAASLAMRPQLLLLDEPTANLDPEGASELREQVARVQKETGSTLIVVEHNLEPWLDQIDRIIVLDDGKVLADGNPEEVLAQNSELLRDAGVWVPGESVEQLIELTGSSDENPLGRPLISAENLQVGYSAGAEIAKVSHADFPAGSVTSLQGPNGSGKTTLALTLAGLLDKLGGELTVDEELRGDLPADPNQWESKDLLGKIAMVFQEPGYQFVTNTVEEELALGLKLKDPDGPVEETVNRFLKELHLEHLRHAHPLSLSGGEKRRLSVATALVNQPEVLVLDEPTFGQDRNTWISLVAMLKGLANAGTTLISSTHDDKFVQVMGGRAIHLPRNPEKPVQRVEDRPNRLSGVNPVFQLLALLIATVPLMLTIDPVSPAVALAIEAVVFAALGFKPKQVLKRIWPLLIATPLAVVSLLLYGVPGGQIYWEFGPAAISDNSITLAVSMGLRVLAVGIPSILILSELKPTPLADALTQTARLPSRFVLSALAGLRMLTLMLADWKALLRARRSRGVAKTGRLAGFLSSSLSLLTFALRRAGALSTAMEARGFGGPTKRTHARPARVGPVDFGALAVAVGIAAAALGSAVWMGQFRWFGL